MRVSLRYKPHSAKLYGHKVKNIFYALPSSQSRDSSVSITMDCGLDDRGSITCRDKNFPPSTASRPALGPTQPHIQWELEAFSSGIQRLERKAYHSHPSSAEIKNDGAIPPLPYTC
jgi:hypothetical protein